jgi:hypothetical protein
MGLSDNSGSTLWWHWSLRSRTWWLWWLNQVQGCWSKNTGWWLILPTSEINSYPRRLEDNSQNSIQTQQCGIDRSNVQECRPCVQFIYTDLWFGRLQDVHWGTERFQGIYQHCWLWKHIIRWHCIWFEDQWHWHWHCTLWYCWHGWWYSSHSKTQSIICTWPNDHVTNLPSRN